LDVWWYFDARGGLIRGQPTGRRLGIGDLCKALIVKVDLPRRELGLAITEMLGKSGAGASQGKPANFQPSKKGQKGKQHRSQRGGGSFKSRKPQKTRGRGKR
jgi:hypothetical protein